jgi:hypothetical protein
MARCRWFHGIIYSPVTLRKTYSSLSPNLDAVRLRLRRDVAVSRVLFWCDRAHSQYQGTAAPPRPPLLFGEIWSRRVGGGPGGEN